MFDDHTVPRGGNNMNQAMGQMQRDVYIYLITPIIRKWGLGNSVDRTTISRHFKNVFETG